MKQKQPTFFNICSSGLRSRTESAAISRIKYCMPLLALVLLFAVLIILMIPKGAVFGSHTDWLSQHVTLAETIRNACLEQHTLLPDWLELGGGANGYQFSYYGFLRPDILAGCLLPQIPMAYILITYMFIIYLSSVLLCFFWLRSEGICPLFAFIGSVLLMTAECMFHMHRQIMFVNYMPFLLLAFLCISKRRTKWLPLCFALIILHSFYFAAAAFAAVGWYWLRREGKGFWKKYFFKNYLSSCVLAAAMSAALLIPTGLVLLEHRRAGSSPSLLELFAPNPVLNNLLFDEYGMGLTLVCLYVILAGLGRKTFWPDSLLFLLMGLFGIFSYVMNLTLYTRPKILIPFMPLVVLLCVRFLQNEPDEKEAGRQRPYPLWPFAVLLPVILLWFSQEQFFWGLMESGLLLSYCLIQRYRLNRRHRSAYSASTETASGKSPSTSSSCRHILSCSLCLFLLLAAPVRVSLATAGTEEWVQKTDLFQGLSEEEVLSAKASVDSGSGAADNSADGSTTRAGNNTTGIKTADPPAFLTDPLYRFDSLTEPLNSSNELLLPGQSKTTMYSSITNHSYSDFYYDMLLTPIRINNRVALLASDNPFLFRLMSVRWLETTEDRIPEGYHVIYRSGQNVIAENPDVLPRVYFTEDTLSQSSFENLETYDRLDALARFTVVDDSETNEKGIANAVAGNTSSNTAGEAYPYESRMETWSPDLSADSLPEGLEITETPFGYQITAKEKCTLSVNIEQPPSGRIVLLDFEVDNLTSSAVVIDINDIRNKLSGRFAAYPNGNHCFHYQFSEPGTDGGFHRLEITFGKGSYAIQNVQWHLYDKDLPGTRIYTPFITKTSASTAADAPASVLISGTIEAETSGYLATSIPEQNGLEILVDGKHVRPVTVNCAFAGVRLEKGIHEIKILFTAPGKKAGCIISITGIAVYGIYLLLKAVKERGNHL